MYIFIMKIFIFIRLMTLKTELIIYFRKSWIGKEKQRKKTKEYKNSHFDLPS